MRRFLLVVLVLLATMLVSAAGAAHGASNKAIWGPVRLPDGSSAFPVYRDLGVRFLQLSLNWAATAPQRPANPRDPSDPAYRWPRELDEAMAEAERHGIELALMAVGSPPWANGGRGPAWAPRNQAYANFLTAASRRYPSVDHWMIWGETNRAEVFRPLPPYGRYGPRRYARLLAAAYRALKRQSRRNVVIGGMTFTFGEVWPRDFVRWARLPNGKPPPLDWWGHNPFSPRFPNLSKPEYRGYEGSRDFSDLDLLHRDLGRAYRGEYRRFRRRPPRIWLSEFTIPAERATYEFPWWTTRRGQAQWLSAAYRIARRTPWIAGLGWIGLLDDPLGTPRGRTNGLMTYEGLKKPAYHAYRRAR